MWEKFLGRMDELVPLLGYIHLHNDLSVQRLEEGIRKMERGRRINCTTGQGQLYCPLVLLFVWLRFMFFVTFFCILFFLFVCFLARFVVESVYERRRVRTTTKGRN